MLSDHEGATSDADGFADLSDRRIGEFLLLRRLGSGGMADVYLAEQTSLERHVAVKVLKAESLQGDSVVLSRRFEQEARAAGGLNHPNVVQIITTGQQDGLAYIVQEYIPGLNLSQWMRRHGAPDYALGLRWLLQVTSALRASSEAGIIHRDIKPENILLTHSEDAKVTDFGLAQLNRPQTPHMNLTQDGTTMGTPWYMSPEQIQGQKLDPRCDQYSLGVTAWHMFAGEPPFPGRNAMTVAAQHLKDKAPDLGAVRADLPVQLCQIIARMLEKRPQDRYADFDSVEKELMALRNVSVNVSSLPDTGLRAAMIRGLRPLRTAAVGALVCWLLSWAMARLLSPDFAFFAGQTRAVVAAESTAARQYARAMLHPDRQDLWRAVSEHFPETLEADMAELQLGVALMYVVANRQPEERAFDSAVAEAEQAFTRVREKGSLAREKNYLEFFGMIGQEWALKSYGDSLPVDSEISRRLAGVTADLDERISRYADDDSMLIDLDRAPVELRDYFAGARSRYLEGAGRSGGVRAGN